MMAGTRFHLALIILATLAFRLPDISVLPLWDWDEGVNLNIATNLAEGRSEWFSIKYLWLPHPPLYYALAAAYMKLTSFTLTSMRSLTVLYSALTAIVIYYIAKAAMDSRAGIFAGIYFAIHPAAAYWGRMALANNQLMLLAALMIYSLMRYSRAQETSWLYITSALLALATLTEYFAVAYTVAAITYLLWFSRHRTLRLTLLSTLPPLAFLLYMYLQAPAEYTRDLLFQLERFKPLGSSALAMASLIASILAAIVFITKSERIKYMFLNAITTKNENATYTLFMFYLPFTALIILIPSNETAYMTALSFHWVASIFGLVYIPKMEHKSIIWLTYASYLLILLGFQRTDHMVMPLYPIMAVGLGIITAKFWASKMEYAKTMSTLIGQAASIVTPALIILPLIALTVQDCSTFLAGGLRSMPIEKVAEVNAQVNSDVSADDLVITYSYFAPYVQAKTTILPESIAYAGSGIAYYRPGMPPERFTQNISILNAKYVVIPHGLINELRTLGYGGFADQISGFRLVKQVNNTGYGPDYQIYKRRD